MRLPEELRSTPVTFALAVAVAAAWLIVFLTGWEMPLAELAFYPAGVGTTVYPLPAWITPLTATLVHLGFLHVALNLLMLLVCGRPVERALGGTGLIVLFLVGTYAAAACVYALDPASQSPMAGAAGAVSAVLGAFALLFGRTKVKVSRPRLGLLLYILWVAAAWIGFQLLLALAFRTFPGITVAATIGGLIAGLLLARPLLLLKWRGA